MWLARAALPRGARLSSWFPKGALAQGALPDPARTPGALNPAVTQETIRATICVSGWTRSIRPGRRYTSTLKREQIAAWRYADQSARHYEEDHLIPLELGGATGDIRNLWPEPKLSSDGWKAAQKDQLEGVLNRMVCDGRISLASAQRAVVLDWTDAYRGIIDQTALSK